MSVGTRLRLGLGVEVTPVGDGRTHVLALVRVWTWGDGSPRERRVLEQVVVTTEEVYGLMELLYGYVTGEQADPAPVWWEASQQVGGVTP